MQESDNCRSTLTVVHTGLTHSHGNPCYFVIAADFCDFGGKQTGQAVRVHGRLWAGAQGDLLARRHGRVYPRFIGAFHQIFADPCAPVAAAVFRLFSTEHLATRVNPAASVRDSARHHYAKAGVEADERLQRTIGNDFRY